MSLPHFNGVSHLIHPMYDNTGTYCNFIDSKDTDYYEISVAVYKLTPTYIGIYINTHDEELVIIDDIFKLMNNNPVMTVNYASPTQADKIIGEIWFKGFKVTHIEGLFTFDNDISYTGEVEDYLRRVKIYYDYDSIEYMKTDDLSLRKNKLNKLMNKDGVRNIINKDMII